MAGSPSMGAADSLNVAGFASVDACAGAASGVAERAAGDLSPWLYRFLRKRK